MSYKSISMYVTKSYILKSQISYLKNNQFCFFNIRNNMFINIFMMPFTRSVVWPPIQYIAMGGYNEY